MTQLKTIEPEKTIHQRLSCIQKELKAPKGQENKFGGYKYRSCEDILEAVKPLLQDGEFLTITDEIVLVGDRYYVKATATFHSGKDAISTQALARESLEKKGMDSAQITGSTSSYARKYSLNGLLLIDDTKDADATNDHKDHKIEPRKNKMQPLDKTGNKAVDKAVFEACQHIKNTVDRESVLSVSRYQWKFCKDSGATQEQLDLIEQEKDNKLTELDAKGA